MTTDPIHVARAHSSGRSFDDVNRVALNAYRRFADSVLLESVTSTTYTGEQLEAQVARYIAALSELGVGLGSRVALLAANSVEVLFVQQAVSFLGAAFVPLHPLGTPGDFAHILSDAGIQVVVIEYQRRSEIGRAIEISGSRAQVLTLGGGGADDLVALAAAEQADRVTLRDIDPEAVCRVIYTGGTTGAPKAAQASFRAMSTMYGIEISDWEWPGEVRTLICAPLSHSGAILFIPTLARGGTTYVAPGFDPVAVLAAIERHRITCILLVPTMISALLDHPRLHDFDVSSLETVLYGASPISPTRLEQAIAHFGPVFFQFYGQAEAPTTLTIMRREEHDVTSELRLSSCGRPVPEADIRLLDTHGHEVADGEPGEICVRGPLVMSGYLDRPEETAEAFRDGWLHTGDVAVRDPDGFLRIVDRVKEIVITGGFNVYPRVIEDVLEEHPGVAAASVFGLPDDRWGEIVVAAVVLGDPATTVAELTAYVRDRKGPVQTPKRIELVAELPLTVVGKKDKKELERVWSDAFERKRAGTMSTEFQEKAMDPGLRALLTDLMEERGLPGLQFAAVRDGRLLDLVALGRADIEHDVAVTDESVFSINSMSKAFTGVALMQLVEAGQLDLDAPVGEYLDYLPATWRAVKVRQLATLTSGLPEIMEYAPEGSARLIGPGDEESAWAAAYAAPLQFETGRGYAYVQTNYALLGKVIDVLAGKPFPAFIRERQFDVAGMPSTVYADDRDIIRNRANTYMSITPDGDPTGRVDNSFINWPPVLRTAAGLHSTAADLANWLIALRGGTLLKEQSSLTELWTPALHHTHPDSDRYRAASSRGQGSRRWSGALTATARRAGSAGR